MGPITLDLQIRQARVGSKCTRLTPTEFDLLATLVRSKGRPFMAGDLLREQVTDADRDRLVTEFIERIERTSDAGAPGGTETGR